MKILFLYPNVNSQHRVPAGPAIMIRILKNLGHEIYLYDTTFTNSGYQKSTTTREEQKTVLKTDMDKYIGEIKDVNHEAELTKVLISFKPDLVCMNTAAHNYIFGISLLKMIKKHGDYPTLVGGIFPTVCPDLVINNEYIDMICVGEGEEAIVSVCKMLENKKSNKDIFNIWYKENGKIHRSPPKLIEDLDNIPYQDWTLFDKRHLWKAFVGKVWKSGGFELSRGCPNRCSFCVEAQKRKNTIGNGKWRREKSHQAVIDEIKYFVKKYQLELITFGDMNFLSGPIEKLKKFSKLYASEIGLPFIIQSGAETLIKEEKVKLLKEMNCVTVSIGIESGVEETRRMVLNKKISDDHIFKAIEKLRKYKIRSTANYIIGLPYDTEEKIKRSMEFNLKLMPDSLDVFYFIPFLGTHLYEVAKNENLLPDNYDISADILSKPCLDLPGLSKSRLEELHEEFVGSYNNKFDELGMQHGILT